MGFYDELKKPAVQAARQPKQFVISSAERQILANRICYAIKQACEQAKRNGKRTYQSLYWCYVDEGADKYREHYRDVNFVCSDILPLDRALKVSARSYGDVYQCARCSRDERDAILPLIQRVLSADGFPFGTVQAHDYLHGATGMGIFKRGGEVFYTFRVDVRW